MNMYDAGSLLAIDCGAAGLSLKKSVALHTDGRQGLLIRRPMRAERW